MTRKTTKKKSSKSRKPPSGKSRRREDQGNVEPEPINPPALGGGKSKGDGPAQT